MLVQVVVAGPALVWLVLALHHLIAGSHQGHGAWQGWGAGPTLLQEKIINNNKYDPIRVIKSIGESSALRGPRELNRLVFDQSHVKSRLELLGSLRSIKLFILSGGNLTKISRYY